MLSRYLIVFYLFSCGLSTCFTRISMIQIWIFSCSRTLLHRFLLWSSNSQNSRHIRHLLQIRLV